MGPSNDRPDFRDIFLREIQQYLPEIETHLHHLSQQPNDQTIQEEIFRRAHSIAGSAAMVDISSIAQVASGMETLMSDILDNNIVVTEEVLTALRHAAARLRQLIDVVRTNGSDRAIVEEDHQEVSSLRARLGRTGGSTPLPRALGGAGAEGQGMPVPFSQSAIQPVYPPQATVSHMPTSPVNDGRLPLERTPLWQEMQEDELSLRQYAQNHLRMVGLLRELGQRFDTERTDLMRFLDGSGDALDRLETWTGQQMGIDLRASNPQVRRVLPLSVLWVVTNRMKRFIEGIHETSRGLTMQQEALSDLLKGLHMTIEKVGQSVQISSGENGTLSATIAQFAWTPAAPSPAQAVSPGMRADLERDVREELRRELEDEVRADLSSQIRRELEQSLRRELTLQVRRELYAELGSGMNARLPLPVSPRQESEPQPRRVVMSETSPETLTVFRDEAEEHLLSISTHLRQLESQPNDMEALRSIRRSMHTIKGAAAITGFRLVADLAHLSEDLLDQMADQTIQMSQEMYSLLLDTSQALEAMVQGDTSEQGGDASLLAALRPRYQALLGERADSANAGPAAEGRAPVQVANPRPHADDDLDRDAMHISQPSLDVGDLSIRLSLRRLDDLISQFSDITVNRNVIDERMLRLKRMATENTSVIDRLVEVNRQLGPQFEAALLPSQPGGFGMQGNGRGNSRFGGVSDDFVDPLEKDRYTEFHLLSRALDEIVRDLMPLAREIETTTRDMEFALAREARFTSQFQDALLKIRLVPFSSIEPRLFRAIQAVAVRYNKEFEFFVEGEKTEVDRGVYEDIVAPLLHLVRNAIYHGIETPAARQAQGKTAAGRITIRAQYEGSQLVIAVSDDGSGIRPETIRQTAIARGLIDAYTRLTDHEVINLIFRPGFSTSDTVTEEAGRGIGLDVVRDMATRLRGTIEVDSIPGQGTTFTMRIPIVMQIQKVVLVQAGSTVYALPMAAVEQLVQLDVFPRSRDGSALEIRGVTYQLVHLSSYLNLPPGPVTDKSPVLLVRSGGRAFGLIVDAVAGRQEDIVVKGLGTHLKRVPWVIGAAVLGTGQVVAILDPVEILQQPPRVGAPMPRIPQPGEAGGQEMPTLDIHQRQGTGPRIPAVIGSSLVPYLLVVDDSPSVRRAVSQTLKTAGWDVQTARDGLEALSLVAARAPAAILLDIEMPRMDGYDLIATLRNQPAYQQLPLIVLTSRSASKHEQRARQLGANDYIVKPYQDDQMLAKIAAWVPILPSGEPRR